MSRMTNFFKSSFRFSETNILLDGARKEYRLLRNDADVRSKPRKVKFTYIYTIK